MHHGGIKRCAKDRSSLFFMAVVSLVVSFTVTIGDIVGTWSGWAAIGRSLVQVTFAWEGVAGIVLVRDIRTGPEGTRDRLTKWCRLL